MIVSLVRSNQERRCGFLKTSNRINVLLRLVSLSKNGGHWGLTWTTSRAQHGMYLFGDSNTYKHIKMWQQVIQMLEENGSLGNSLALHCPRHPDTALEVATPDDFATKAPEGGCDLMCDWRLACGHQCINKCHSRILHQEVYCREDCLRSLVGCDHACALPCGARCGPCKFQLHDIQLPCGHVEANLDCSVAQDPQRATCRKTVLVEIPLCGHEVQKKCYEADPGPNYECPAVCGEPLSCGHSCGSKCHKCRPRLNGQILQINHGACAKRCGRAYNACSHYCNAPCHHGSGCQLCSAPCEVRCVHSRCAKPCNEPCAPCAEACTWACPHTGKCDLPCAVPCNKLPCSKRCSEMLECGHQCPSVCGETCPSIRYCQTCCSAEIKDVMVDYVSLTSYGETNLDEDPCLVPDCGHILTVSSMDGSLRLTDYYEANSNGEITALKGSSLPFSREEIRTCPTCRGSLRSINRYSRIVRRSAIDEATKRFISWSNSEIIKHAEMLHKVQQQFSADQDTTRRNEHGAWRAKVDVELGNQSDSVTLRGHRNQVMADISRIPCLKSRYKEPYRLRQKLNKFVHAVRESEQPFGKLWDLVQARRRRNHLSRPESDLIFEPSVPQLRAFLTSMSLSIRFDITIIADALSQRKKRRGLSARYEWGAVQLEVDLSQLREECLTLIDLLNTHQQHRLEIETRVSFAHLAALERSAIISSHQIGRSNTLDEQGLEQLQIARGIHNQYPGQTTGVMEALEAVELMLNDGTFYNVLTSEEMRAVYAAMSRDFSGTGHWYTCENNHPFTVGECGMPMEQRRCPQCGSPIGGVQHQPAPGVRSLDEVQVAMGDMRLAG